MTNTAEARIPAQRVPSMMTAAVIQRPGRVEIIETAVPEPGENQALIRVEGCGVCASNLARWEGREWFSYPGEPGEPGHEGVGTIAALGRSAAGWRIGQRVAFLSNRAYAEYDVAGVDGMAEMPAEFDGKVLPGEPLGCAWNIFRRSGIEMGGEVAVVGSGFLGALLCQLAAHAGACVSVVARRPFDPAVARVLDVAETLDFGEARAAADSGRSFDVVIEVTGKQGPLDLAARLTRERGRLVIAGYHQDGARQVDMQLWNWRGLDVINAHERDPAVYVDGMRRAFAATVEGVLNPWPLFTHHFPLDRLGEALELARLRPAGFMKSIVHP